MSVTLTMPHVVDSADPVSWLASADMADEAGDVPLSKRLRTIGRSALAGSRFRETASARVSRAVRQTNRENRLGFYASPEHALFTIWVLPDSEDHIRIGGTDALLCGRNLRSPVDRTGRVNLPDGFTWGVVFRLEDDPLIVCRLSELAYLIGHTYDPTKWESTR